MKTMAFRELRTLVRSHRATQCQDSCPDPCDISKPGLSYHHQHTHSHWALTIGFPLEDGWAGREGRSHWAMYKPPDGVQRPQFPPFSLLSHRDTFPASPASKWRPTLLCLSSEVAIIVTPGVFWSETCPLRQRGTPQALPELLRVLLD